MKEYIIGMGSFLTKWFWVYRIHIVFWTVYILYESGLTGIFAGRFGKAENYIVHYLLNISLFYAHSCMMDVFAKGRFYFLKVVFLVGLEIALYVPVLATLNHLFTDYNQATATNSLGIDGKFIGGAVYRSIFFIIVSTGYWFLRQYLKQRKRASQLETDRLEQIVKRESAEKNLLIARNAHLRAQVSPHLLFNALTFIYRRVKKTDPLAGEAIISLTSLMRYSVESNYGMELVPLAEEVEQVKDLENILKILKGGEFYFRMDIDEAVLSLSAVPLILLTLMENMYKHGDLSDPGNYGEMSVSGLDGKIVFHTRNVISELSRPISMKTGLINLRNRLSDHYAAGAEMTYGAINGRFEVSIKIPGELFGGGSGHGQRSQAPKRP